MCVKLQLKGIVVYFCRKPKGYNITCGCRSATCLTWDVYSDMIPQYSALMDGKARETRSDGLPNSIEMMSKVCFLNMALIPAVIQWIISLSIDVKSASAKGALPNASIQIHCTCTRV